MATTFRRIQLLIDNVKTKNKWNNAEEIVQFIRSQRIKEFQTKKGKSSDIENYMKLKTIEKLVETSKELELIEQDKNGTLKISAKGMKATLTDDNYKRQIKSSVKSLLNARRAPMTEILRASEKIKLPNLPDASTIHENLAEGINISEKELRKFLFLYALADGIDRKTKVIYLKK